MVVATGWLTYCVRGRCSALTLEEKRVRKLIAAMKMSIDGKIAGPDGDAPWVDAWSNDYGLTPQVDACVLGGGMYPVYEQSWIAVQREPHNPHPLSGKVPTPAEVDWAGFAARTPHYVLSSTLETAEWSTTTFIRGIDEVATVTGSACGRPASFRVAG
jgi:hypothetical protein